MNLIDPTFADLVSALWGDYEQSWRREAACLDMWSEIFQRPEYEDFAKRTCESCPVRLECLNEALYHEDEFIRGGYNEAERKTILLHRSRYKPYFDHDVKV